MTDDDTKTFYRETHEHIESVQRWISLAIGNLKRRRLEHDRSKLVGPEDAAFMALGRDQPMKGIQYGSDAYFEALGRYPDAIMHHYLHNDHHPEHFAFENGILDPQWVKDGTAIRTMSLLSLTEMICDWKAATLRMKDGDLRRSITQNQERFGYSDELKSILLNTANELGMLD